MNDEKQKKLEKNTRNLLETLGEDPNREGLINTPKRVAKAWQFLTKGYTEDLDKLINNAIFEGESKDMVIVKNIEFYSLCEHHMIPFYGKAHIGYIPDGKIIGLSKLARITDLFSQRLQVQERLTDEIKDCIQETLNPKGVAVVIEAQHLCMQMRGVQKQHSSTTTSAFSGILLKDDKTYPWICIKKEPFPRVFYTRRVIKDGSEYFGPYTNMKTVMTLLGLVRSLYPLRSLSLIHI